MTAVDCSFTHEDNWFRFRTGALIVAEGQALFMYSDTAQHYYSLGGAVQLGETIEDAVRREVQEETGIDFQIDRLLCLIQNFFQGTYGSIDGKICHTLEFIFLMKAPEQMLFDAHSVNMDGDQEGLVWLPLDELDQYDIRPTTLISLVRQPPETFTVLVNDERGGAES